MPIIARDGRESDLQRNNHRVFLEPLVSASTTIVSLEARDIRFPTSRELDGSDAMHADPDYSAAYVVLETDGGQEGHGVTFPTGRGTDIVCAASRGLAPLVVGRELESFTADMAGFWRHLTSSDTQLRWIG